MLALRAVAATVVTVAAVVMASGGGGGGGGSGYYQHGRRCGDDGFVLFSFLLQNSNFVSDITYALFTTWISN
jgi:hypothetical protein